MAAPASQWPTTALGSHPRTCHPTGYGSAHCRSGSAAAEDAEQVSLYPNPAIEIGPQVHAPLLRQRFGLRHQVPDDLVQLDRLAIDTQLFRISQGERRQVSDDAAELLDLLDGAHGIGAVGPIL